MKKIFLIVVSTLFFAPSAFAGKGYTADTQPATCVDGDFWIDTNGATGERFYVCEEGAWVKSVGYGASANPSFNSVHASGGNLAAANAQVTKKWIAGLPYTANVTSVIYGGKHYICTSSHTADSTTEPGVGASWATVWSEVAGGGVSAWSDVQALISGTGDYIKYDGTRGTPAGSTYTAGTGIDITGGVISSTVTGSVPSGTVNGQALLWATDQWVASTPPWVTTASLGTGVAIALAAAVDGTGGLASKASLDALPNIVFGTGLTVAEDTPSAGTDTVSITANTYQAYDADLTTAAGATGAGNSKYFGTNSGGTAGFYDLPTGGEGYTNLTAFVGQTAWRLFYSDGSGDVKELAMGASGTVLKSNGESAAPSFQTDSTGTGGGTGDDISVIDCGDSATTTSITIDGGDAS